MKPCIISFILALFLFTNAGADTIIYKDGQRVECKILKVLKNGDILIELENKFMVSDFTPIQKRVSSSMLSEVILDNGRHVMPDSLGSILSQPNGSRISNSIKINEYPNLWLLTIASGFAALSGAEFAMWNSDKKAVKAYREIGDDNDADKMQIKANTKLAITCLSFVGMITTTVLAVTPKIREFNPSLNVTNQTTSLQLSLPLTSIEKFLKPIKTIKIKKLKMCSVLEALR
jgi:hypothetical protein